MEFVAGAGSPLWGTAARFGVWRVGSTRSVSGARGGVALH